MVKSNYFWITVLIIISILSYYNQENVGGHWTLIPGISLGILLIITLFIFTITDGYIFLIYFFKPKKVIHTECKNYWIRVNSQNRMCICYSHLLFNREVDYFYLNEQTNLKRVKELINNTIYSDLPKKKKASKLNKDITNWSGALTENLERDNTINNILNK